MKISKVPKLLETAHKAGQSVYLKGAPGTAKTSAVRQYAQSKGLELIHIHAPLTDPLDIKGLPTVAGNEAQFLPLKFWPKETDRPVVVLIDELPQCAVTIINAYSQLLIDHQVGEVKLPKGSLVVATGNRREDKSAANNLPNHVINRVLHVTVETHAEDFLDWALHNGIHPSIVAFGKFRPDCLHSFDPKQNLQEPFATYRTWEKASDFIKQCDDDEILLESLSGLVGEGPASEYLAFRRLYLGLPDMAEVLKNPGLVQIPSDPAVLYAMATAAATIAKEPDMDNLITLAKRFPTEYGVMLIKTANKLLPLNKSKVFRSWALENKDVIL